MKGLWSAATLGALLLAVVSAVSATGGPGQEGSSPQVSGDYKVLAPITHGNLTIFPIVSAKTHDTGDFLTLDDGIRSGDVMVTEVGNLHGVMQRRPNAQYRYGNAEVNRLVLVNNSKRPLILLAGEIVTGGKQDRVVGKDRIVPPESDPVDLNVFCVEPGRWVETPGKGKFDTHAAVMAQPSVRKKAMVDADQQKVWAEVGRSNRAMVMAAAPPAHPSATPVPGSTSETVAVTAQAAQVETYSSESLRSLGGTTSYAKTRENKQIQKQVDDITEPMQKSYASVIHQLRNQNAVGVVVAVKGRIVWADIFASPALLSKYWPKLLQSYAAEALTAPGDRRDITEKEAQKFLENWQARHEVVDSEPGLYRQRELIGDNFRAFELTSLLPKQNFDLHLSKMAE